MRVGHEKPGDVMTFAVRQCGRQHLVTAGEVKVKVIKLVQLGPQVLAAKEGVKVGVAVCAVVQLNEVKGAEDSRASGTKQVEAFPSFTSHRQEKVQADVQCSTSTATYVDLFLYLGEKRKMAC